MIKYYNLKAGDVWNNEGQLLTFIKMDGAYAQWSDEEGKVAMGHSKNYELRDDGYFYSVT